MGHYSCPEATFINNIMHEMKWRKSESDEEWLQSVTIELKPVEPEGNLSHSLSLFLGHSSHLYTICKLSSKFPLGQAACTPISALWLWSPPHQGPSKLSPYQPAHSSLDRTGHFLLRQEHSGRDLHFTPSIKLRDFPRLRGPPQNPTKLITRLLKPTFVDDTGCFVLGRPYGRRGAGEFCHFLRGGEGGCP